MLQPLIGCFIFIQTQLIKRFVSMDVFKSRKQIPSKWRKSFYQWQRRVTRSGNKLFLWYIMKNDFHGAFLFAPEDNCGGLCSSWTGPLERSQRSGFPRRRFNIILDSEASSETDCGSTGNLCLRGTGSEQKSLVKNCPIQLMNTKWFQREVIDLL